MTRIISVLSFLCLVLPLTSGALYERISQLPNKKFDVIIVGGGTAGNVVANRLTENKGVSVLVLEAGPSNENVVFSQVPAFCLTTNPLYDWNYTSAPQSHLNGRTFAYPRGFILGGSSSINWMGYTRGSSEDYDRYAAVTGDQGWSWNNLQKYIRKNEAFALSIGRNISGDFNPAAHGYHGVNSVTLAENVYDMDNRVIRATQGELKDQFPYNLDMNSGFHLGIGWVQSTIKNGTRSSSATSYLGPGYIDRPNLSILVSARVTRVIPNSQGQTSFRGVEFTQDGGVTMHILEATKEVVLSAGTMGTPHILLHSGIGDADSLTRIGISPLHNLSSVGQNMSEQPGSTLTWAVNSTETPDEWMRNSTVFDEVFEQWKTSRTGPLIDEPMNELGFFRVKTQGTTFEDHPDPAAGPNTAHYELFMMNGHVFGPSPPTGSFFSILISNVSPAARGSVSINSSNPFDQPIINPNILGTDWDRFVMREAIRSAKRFINASAWDGYVISRVPLFDPGTSDAELDAFLVGGAAASAHPVGTASMSAWDATDGVVNPDLRVKGLEGLRVVDASVLPFVPAGHTQAPVYILAERAADIIKKSL
ncbi:alcohol oxidase [Mycena floridula]|nr:alcohol oxidase [Mycena floridula]KAJ7587940.1 alcohol oxidase [Mycena floridula]